VKLVSTTGSDAMVRFGPVQRPHRLNLGLDHRSGPHNSLNLGLDFEGPVQLVQFSQVLNGVRTYYTLKRSDGYLVLINYVAEN
jgi:hypothetical protein